MNLDTSGNIGTIPLLLEYFDLLVKDRKGKPTDPGFYLVSVY